MASPPRPLALALSLLSWILGAPAAAAQDPPAWQQWWQGHRQDYLVPNRLPGAEALNDPEAQDETSASRAPIIAEKAREFALEHLEDQDAGVRMSAALVIGRLGGVEGAEAILDRIPHESGVVGYVMLLALGLGATPNGIDALLDVSTDGLWKRHRLDVHADNFATVGLAFAREHGGAARLDKDFHKQLKKRKRKDEPSYSALCFMAISPTEELREFALKKLADGQAHTFVRRRAAESLGLFDDEEVAKALKKYLKRGADIELRRSVALSIGEVDAEGMEEFLVEAYEDESEQAVRANLLTSIGRIGGDAAFDLLLEESEKGNTQLRAFALLGMALMAREGTDPRAVRVLEDAVLQAKSDSERNGAVLAMGIARAEGGVPLLRDVLLEGASASARANAALALGMIGGEEARAALLEAAAKEQSAELVVRLITGLGLVGEAEDAEVLIELFGDLRGTEVRQPAVWGLALHGSERILDLLFDMAEDQSEDNPTRAAAMRGIGMMLEDGPRPLTGRLSRLSNPAARPDWLDGIWGLEI